MTTTFITIFIFSSLSVFSIDDNCGTVQCSPFTPAEKRRILDLHNNLRNDLAGGGIPGQPGATNMNSLIWDDALSNVAQTYAETCPGLAHNKNRQTQYLQQRKDGNTKWTPDNSPISSISIGENVAGNWGPAYDIDGMLNQAESGWWDEYKNYAYGTFQGTNNCNAANGKRCGHYTQMAWATTRYIGCGYVNGCSGQTFEHLFVCNYFPSGNYAGQFPYKSGASCTNCDSDRIECDSSLCGGGACPSFCDGTSSISCNDNAGQCQSNNNIDCDDGTGRNICPTVVTHSPTVSPIKSPTESPTPTTAVTKQCVYGTNYQFNGNQAYATGDPHFRMWNGDYHDFQGVGSIDNQYYYITRSFDSSSKDLPFNILGKHYYWNEPNTQMRALDYITIELFDTNNDYYLIFLQNNILKYTTNPVPANTPTLYNSISSGLLSDLIIGQSQQIGSLFTAQITSKTNDRIDFILTTDGHCELSLYMQNIGNPKSALNNRYLQNLYINPPNCYQCFITGLLGDFKQTKVGNGANWYEGREGKIQSCNGNYIDIKAGWTSSDPMVQNTAFDNGGLSYKKSECNRGLNRRRILSTIGTYQISAPDDFVYVDLCPINSAIAQLTITECQNIRQQYDLTLCAHESMIDICNSLQDNCEYDACVSANGDITSVAAAAENIFGTALGFLESIPNIVDLYNPQDTELRVDPISGCNHHDGAPTNECINYLHNGNYVSWQYYCVNETHQEERYFNGADCDESKSVFSYQYECGIDNNCYCGASASENACDSADVTFAFCNFNSSSEEFGESYQYIIDECLADGAGGYYSYQCNENGEFVYKYYETDSDCSEPSIYNEIIPTSCGINGTIAALCTVNQPTEPLELVDRITSDCAGNEIGRKRVTINECQFDTFPNGPAAPFKYVCNNNQLGIKYYSRGSGNCNGDVDVEYTLDSDGQCLEGSIFSSTCGDTSTSTCIEELNEYNVGAIYEYNGGCKEHFSALEFQDKSGSWSYLDCYTKCKELGDNCKSFFVGKKGVVRENWCNIYSEVCTFGVDDDWYMFTPINNAAEMCNSIDV